MKRVLLFFFGFWHHRLLCLHVASTVQAESDFRCLTEPLKDTEFLYHVVTEIGMRLQKLTHYTAPPDMLAEHYSMDSARSCDAPFWRAASGPSEVQRASCFNAGAVA